MKTLTSPRLLRLWVLWHSLKNWIDSLILFRTHTLLYSHYFGSNGISRRVENLQYRVADIASWTLRGPRAAIGICLRLNPKRSRYDYP